MKKKIISLLLAVVLIVGTLPLSAITAFAADGVDAAGVKSAFQAIQSAAGSLGNKEAPTFSAGFDSLVGALSKSNTIVGAVNGTVSLLRLLGVMEDPTTAKLNSISAQIQSLDEKVSAMSNDVKKIADNLTGLTADTKLNERGLKANQMQQNWNSFNTNYVDKGIEPLISEFEAALVERVKEWIEHPETRQDTIVIKYDKAQEPKDTVFGKSEAGSTFVIEGVKDLKITWNPNTYPADIAGAIKNSLSSKGNRAVWNEAVDTLLYDLSAEVVRAKGTNYVYKVRDAFNNYCTQLVNSTTGVTALVQSMYLTHTFEYQIRDQINELFNRILVEVGGYSVFAMNILGMSDTATDLEKENAAKTLCDTVKFLTDGKKNAVTGYDNYCYITNSLVYYSSIKYKTREQIFTREWSEQALFWSIQYRRLEIAQPGSEIYIEESIGKPVGDANGIAILRTLQQNGVALNKNVFDRIKDPRMNDNLPQGKQWGNEVITSYGSKETLNIDNSVKVNCFKAIGNFIGGGISNTTLGSMPGDFSSTHFYERKKIDGSLLDLTTGQMQSNKTLIASATYGQTEKSWRIDEAYAFWGPSDYPLIVDTFSKNSGGSFHNYFFGCEASYPILVSVPYDKLPSTPPVPGVPNPLKDFSNYTKENGLIYSDAPASEEELKAENNYAVSGDHTVSLLGVGEGGKDEAEWDHVISANPVDVPGAIKNKIGVGRKVLVSDDICVARDGNPCEGEFMIGFSGEAFTQFKDSNAVVYCLNGEGGVEELTPTWNEERQCFTVVTENLGCLVLVVDSDKGDEEPPQLEEYPIKVGNTRVTSSNKDDVLGDGKISYDPITQTLTLNNAEIAIDGKMCPSAINSELKGDLTIKLIGENQIGAKPSVAADKSNYKVLYGIAASDDDVTITGDGSLTMYTWMSGIRADNVNIPTDFAGTLTIENYGEIVYITENVYYSDMPAIRADSNVGIRGGTVNVTCYDGGGIYAGEGNIVIEGGATVNVTSDKFSAIKAAPGSIEDDEIIGSYYAGGGDVYIYNGAKVTVNAGTKAEELLTDVYGIYAAGCVEIGFEDEIYDDPAEQPPTPAPEEVSVTVGNTNLSGAYDIDGIKSENGNISVIGSKISVISVNGRGFNIGVCGGPECGDIIIIDSTVDVDAGTSGIVAFEDGIDCDVTITNSTVNVKAENWGINALNDVAITDSKVTVESDTWGIECDTLTVEGTQTQIKSTGGEVGLVVWGGENALTVKNGSLQLVGGEMAFDAGENGAFTMSLPAGYALKGNPEKNVFTDLQNITLKKYSGKEEFYEGHAVAYVGNEPAKSVVLGHNPELVNGKDATDTEAGYKSYYECKICGKYYEDAEEKTEITDLDAWKAEGGYGYLAPLHGTDDNHDHKCDYCDETISSHVDTDPKDHVCDYCGNTFSGCADENKDHKCDYCEKVLSECKDADKDHKCDICGKQISEHNAILVEGTAATLQSAGHKSYYKCDCGKFFEDATCKVEITDLDAWKAAGGNGYIAKLEEEPTSPQTGDNSHMTLWVMLLVLSSMGLCACLVLGKKRKYSK